MFTDLWKWVQLRRTERSPPLSAAVNTNSWQSQTLHSLSHHNLGGKQKKRGQGRADKKEIFIILILVMYVQSNKNTSKGRGFFSFQFLQFPPMFFNFDWPFFLNYTKMKCRGSNVLPRALNICMPPYFPSKSTVLLRGLNALHILTKTTSKQPGRTAERERDCLSLTVILRLIYWKQGK